MPIEWELMGMWQPSPTLSGSPSPDARDLADWTQRHDEASFGRLVDRHYPMVKSTCLRRLRAADADDAAQAVFIVLSRKAGRIRDPARLGAWLHGVALHVIAHHLRATARRAAHRGPAMPLPAADGTEAPWESVRARLDEAIAGLVASVRGAVVAHYLEGRSHAEVGAALNISAEAARKRATAGLEELRRWFKRHGLAIAVPALVVGLQGEIAAIEPASATGCAQAILHAGTSPQATVLAQAGVPSLPMILPLVAVGAAAAMGLILTLGMPFGSDRASTAPAQPAVAAAAEPGPAGAASALDQRIDVCYRRDHLCEVLEDLRRRTGVDIGNPPALDRSFYITCERQGSTLREILARIAVDGGLRLVVKGDSAVFWKTADDETIAALGRQAGSGGRDQQMEAIAALGGLADPRIYPPLIAALSDPDAAVASYALLHLAGHPLFLQDTPVPAPPVVRWIGHHTFGEYAADVIAQARLAAVVPLLIDLAEGLPRARAEAALFAMAFPQEGQGVDYLCRRLATADGDQRDCLIAQIGSTRSQRALAAIERAAKAPTAESFELVAGKLRKARQDEDRTVRLFRALKQMPGERAAALLMGIDPTSLTAGHADELAEILTRHGSPEVIAAMIAAIQGKDAGKRCQAARFFSWRREPDAIPALVGAEPPGGDPAAIAAWASTFPRALAAARDQRATQRLLRLTAHSERPVRLAALGALGATRDDGVLAPLVAACADSDSDATRAALASLAMLRTDAAADAIVDRCLKGAMAEALPALRTVMEDPLAKHLPLSLVEMAATDKEGRQWLANGVIFGLHRYWQDDPRYQRILAGLCAEGDISFSAGEGLGEGLLANVPTAGLALAIAPEKPAADRLRALGQIASRVDLRGVDLLKPLLDDANPAVRAEAIRGLGLLAAPGSIVPMVDRFADDPECEVRQAVGFAYMWQAPFEAVPTLRRMCDPSTEPDEYIRESAREALRRIGGAEADRILFQFPDPEAHRTIHEGDVIVTPAAGVAN